MFARDFTRALGDAERALSLTPNDLALEINRAHALMFLERLEEARRLYLAHRGEVVPANDNDRWEAVILDDFAQLRKAGLSHPMMDEIASAFGRK